MILLGVALIVVLQHQVLESALQYLSVFDSPSFKHNVLQVQMLRH